MILGLKKLWESILPRWVKNKAQKVTYESKLKNLCSVTFIYMLESIVQHYK